MTKKPDEIKLYRREKNATNKVRRFTSETEYLHLQH